MIKCKDCKHFFIDRKGAGGCYKADEDPRNHSCIHAERADGLVECCATCRHIMNNACLQGYHCTGNIVLEKMLCPEWQPREEER